MVQPLAQSPYFPDGLAYDATATPPALSPPPRPHTPDLGFMIAKLDRAIDAGLGLTTPPPPKWPPRPALPRPPPTRKNLKREALKWKEISKVVSKEVRVPAPLLPPTRAGANGTATRRLSHRVVISRQVPETPPLTLAPPLLERVPSGPAHGSGPREFDHPLREKKRVEGGETGLFST